MTRWSGTATSWSQTATLASASGRPSSAGRPTPNPVGGYEYARDITDDEQAQYIVRAYQMMKAWGWVGPAFLWNLNYNLTAPGKELAAFGIAGRPAQAALQGMPK